jgi:CDGSH-type Zn-finger protein
MTDQPRTTIRVSENGPYLVEGGLEVRNVDGQALDAPERYALCRCGGSSNKPFCDGTHLKIGFDGTESADSGPIAARQDSYTGEVTINDDRSVCAHAGFCTDNLSAVFKLGEEPWIDATAADVGAIVAQVNQCPSGALTVTVDGQPAEDELEPGVMPVPNGPYRVSGGVQVLASDDAPYEVRNRQTLCRCGGSSNKPFCNGTHWHIGFEAP